MKQRAINPRVNNITQYTSHRVQRPHSRSISSEIEGQVSLVREQTHGVGRSTLMACWGTKAQNGNVGRSHK